MGRALLKFGTLVLLALLTAAGLLANVDGAVSAVGWACDTFGPLPVVSLGSFLFGILFALAALQALGPRR